MKRTVIIVLLIIFGSLLFATEIEGQYFGIINPIVTPEYKYVSSMSQYRFQGNRYYLSMDVPKGSKAEREIPEKLLVAYGTSYNEEGAFSLITTANGIQHLSFTSDSGFTYKKELGVLYNQRRLFLFEDDAIFFEPTEDYQWDGILPKVVDIATSSALKEKERVYSGLSFIRRKTANLIPWVEAAEGQGIGEWIELKIKVSGQPLTSLLVSDGYVSFKKPSLFSLNSRVKDLKITCQDIGLDLMVPLKDTPGLQEIKLPKAISNQEIKIKCTIESTYPGEKWSDTCLSLIYPLGSDPYTEN